MMVRDTRVFGLAVVVLSVLSATFATAAPEVVPYFGYLTYETGAPYEETIGQLDVALWATNSPVDGVDMPLWQDSLSNVPVLNGVISLLLGTPSNPITSAILDQPGTALFLSFTVDGTELSGFQRIASVPFALRAGDADTVGGMPAASLLTTDDVTSADFVAVDGSSTMTGQLNVDATVDALGDVVVGDTLLLGDGAGGCTAAREGGLRYNAAESRVEFCDGEDWQPLTAGDGGAMTGGGTGTGDGSTSENAGATCQAIFDAFPGSISGDRFWLDPDGTGPVAAFETSCLFAGGLAWALLAKIGSSDGESWRFDSTSYADSTTFGGNCIFDASDCDGKSAAYSVQPITQLRFDLGSIGHGIYSLNSATPTTLNTFFNPYDPTTTVATLGSVIATRTGGSVSKYNTAYMGTTDGEETSSSSSDRCRLHFTSEVSLTEPGLSDNNTETICVGRVRGVNSSSFESHPNDIQGSDRADLARFANGGAPTLPGALFLYGR